MDSIMGNNTWVLADLPPGCKPLGCKWIFKRKLNVDGTIKKFKARLVIQGFRQKLRIDYFDTYAPVACISTIRLLIAMTSIHNLIIHQMDVKTVFLNGELDEEVYMNQPQGFIVPGKENKVDQTKDFLLSKFSMKDMREAYVILGIRIKHESNEIAISQSHYIKKAVSQVEYSRVIGCLMYVMTCTRPDIAFVVGKLSSAATLAKAYSQIYKGKSRQLGIRHSMIRELITNEVVSIKFMRFQQNLADHLTKGLARDLVIKSVEWM
ncbi:zinc finger, CCHC-type containing protein [Tanacetum coccineum]